MAQTLGATVHEELPIEAEDFLTWLAAERGRSVNTLRAYRRDLRSWTGWLREQGLDLLSVGTSDLDRFVASRRAASAAPASVARQLAAIRMLHRFLVDDEVRRDDPTADGEGVRVPSGIPHPLSEAEVATLLASPAGVDPLARRDLALLELLYATGARVSEVCGLSLGDLDHEQRLVRLFGKGAKERIVPFGGRAATALEEWLGPAGRALVAPERPARRGDAAAVFLNHRGGRLTRQGAWWVLRDHAQRCGLGERVSPHVLRHSCATHLLDHGADLRVVQEVLGHASISTTQVYTRVSQERMWQVYRDAHPRARRA